MNDKILLTYLIILKEKTVLKGLEPELLVKIAGHVRSAKSSNGTISLGSFECKVCFMEEMSTLDVALVIYICLSL